MATTANPQCRISIDPQHRWISVRSDYSGGFVAESRSAGGTWDRTTRVWIFDTHSGITLDHVKQICRRHYDNVFFVDGATLAPITAAPTPDAGYLGVVGGTLTVMARVGKIVDLQGQYGTTRLTIMRDADGHVIVWRAANERLEVGEHVTITGKVKTHEAYRGVSQTVLTRCKVIQKHAAPVAPVAELPPINPQHMMHFMAIQSVLTPEEAQTIRDAVVALKPAELRVWLDEMNKLTVPDAVRRLRCTLVGAPAQPQPQPSLADEVGF